MYEPSWAKFDIKTKKGAEAFDEERQREIRTNPQAKRWEESRKRTIQAQKHDYHIKEEQQENEFLRNSIKEMKDAGDYDKNLIPMKGFILVRPDKFKKETDTGLKLPDELIPTVQTGEVVAVGMQDLPVGSHILFKKGAGVDVIIKGEALLLMRCVEDIQLTDVLGIFE